MQVLIATSRTINQDPLYQKQKKKRMQLHIDKIKNIANNRLKPFQLNMEVQKNLRKAKSTAKLFQKQQQRIELKRENKILLTKLMNIEPTIKAGKVMSKSKDRNYMTTSSNWVTKKKQQQKIKKENELIQQRFKKLSSANVKDVKRKIQEQIREYLQLKNQIRKIKPLNTLTTGDGFRSHRVMSQRKIKASLPLFIEVQNQQNKNSQLNEEKIEYN